MGRLDTDRPGGPIIMVRGSAFFDGPIFGVTVLLTKPSCFIISGLNIRALQMNASALWAIGRVSVA